MSNRTVGVYTIGQTPRPDLTEDLARRFPSTRFDVMGALDGLTEDELAAGANEPAENELANADVQAAETTRYPVETRLRDGTRIVFDAAFLEPLLQASICARDVHVTAHLVLCAGPFPNLTGEAPVLRPFDLAAADFARRGFETLDVVVPFAAQARPAARKWERAGFSCRTLALDGKPDDVSVARWLTLQVPDADALVFDYVGFPSRILDEVAAQVSVPVFDLGHLALDALEQILSPT
jgi:protein AroM